MKFCARAHPVLSPGSWECSETTSVCACLCVLVWIRVCTCLSHTYRAL